MLQIGIDCHIHTIFSGHAHCTIRDHVMEAADRKLQGIGIADHCGYQFLNIDWNNIGNPMQVFSVIGNFFNPAAIPDVWHGVRIYNSVEIDINDKAGNLFGDEIFLPKGFGQGGLPLSEAILDKADYAVASVHYIEGAKSVTPVQGTEMYCNVLRRDKVLILGHIGRSRIPFEVDEVVKCAKETGKLIEINNHSFDFSDDIYDICKNIALRCAELGAMIAVNSDAHCSADTGIIDRARRMLEEIRFPQELVANESLAKFDAVRAKALG